MWNVKTRVIPVIFGATETISKSFRKYVSDIPGNLDVKELQKTVFAMTSLKFTVVPHPPYSPDLAPSDFWLFPNLKETLKGQHFLSDAKVEAAVRKWISSKPETFFINGMEKWIERVKKCMAINGDYVEK